MDEDAPGPLPLSAPPRVLYHFSEDPGIRVFVPRATIAKRPPGREWLNGPLVWAIDEWHAPCYLFPRECPRILWWPLPDTMAEDLAEHWAGRTCRMIANVEWGWLDRMRTTTLYRYTLPAQGFHSLEDHGVHANHDHVAPLEVEPIPDILASLAAADVELRFVPSLLHLRHMWDTTLHVSGMRLRNARDWE